MAVYKVDISGVNTSRLPVLSDERKESLMKRIKAGDEEAREEFITGNLRLVLSVLQRFNQSSESADDLFQIGCVGLIKAMDNFDTEMGVKFSTYAYPMIAGELKRYLRDNSSIRVSRTMKDLAYKALYAAEGIRRKNDREPTLFELAGLLDVKPGDLAEALEAVQSPVSLYEPVYTDSGDSLYIMDQISDKKNREDNWIEDISLKEAVRRLDKRENAIINMRFFQGMTQMEVAKEINISQAQVSRLEKEALKSMREYLK